MELLETQDPEKKKLIEASDRHKHELEKELHALTEKTSKALTHALIIGGSLALTYFVISSLYAKKKKRKKNKIARAQAAQQEDVEEMEAEDSGPSVLGQIGTRVLNQATIMLLDIAKEKLFEYLESRKKTDENS